MPDFIAETTIYWSKDRTRLVGEGDEDADLGALFAGPGGVVPEDQARRTNPPLVADKALSAFGREHGRVLGTEPTASRQVEPLAHSPIPPPAKSTAAER